MSQPSPSVVPVALEWPLETGCCLAKDLLDQRRTNNNYQDSEILKMSNGFGSSENAQKKLKRRKRGNPSRANMVTRAMKSKEPIGIWTKNGFPGLSMNKLQEIEVKRQVARAARAAEQNFLCDEQRTIMEDFENENPYGNSSDYKVETRNSALVENQGP